jgi:hypothetical protein
MLKRNSESKLKAFAKEHSFKDRMSKGGLDSYNNYIGPDLGDMVIVYSKSRDSDLMVQSNFDVALDMLGGEGRYVEVHNFGHWGCGWIEAILVNPKSKTKLKKAYAIRKSLEDYPLLDDSDYSERELEAIEEDIKYYMSDFERNLRSFLGVEDLESVDTESNIEGFLAAVYQHDCGYQGHENAYVTDRSITRFVKDHYSGCLDYRDTPIHKACVARITKAA